MLVDNKLHKEQIDELLVAVDLVNGQPIDKFSSYVDHHLAEVVIKALSPGINDPETAVLSIHALADLFRYRLYNYLPLTFADENKVIRISVKELSFEELFVECFHPIWSYGKDDKYIQEALLSMTGQLLHCDVNKGNQIILQ